MAQTFTLVELYKVHGRRWTSNNLDDLAREKVLSFVADPVTGDRTYTVVDEKAWAKQMPVAKGKK